MNDDSKFSNATSHIDTNRLDEIGILKINSFQYIICVLIMILVNGGMYIFFKYYKKRNSSQQSKNITVKHAI